MDKLGMIIHREAELQRRFLHWHHRLQQSCFLRMIKAICYALTFGFRKDEIKRLRKAGVIK
jgi:UDP-3-O-acyl-N-acetylglucosamine deacetylase